MPTKCGTFPKLVLGKHKLNDLMKDISIRAGLSRIYTNHCIRASTVTELSEKVFDKNLIAIVSGHKRLESVERYTARCTMNKKIKLSNALSFALTVTEPSDGTDNGETHDLQQKSESSCTSQSAEKENDKPTLVLEKNGLKCLVFMRFL